MTAGPEGWPLRGSPRAPSAQTCGVASSPGAAAFPPGRSARSVRGRLVTPHAPFLRAVPVALLQTASFPILTPYPTPILQFWEKPAFPRASGTCRPARGGHAREEVGGACGRLGADRHLRAKKGGNVTDELKGQHKCLRKRPRYKIHIRKEVRFRPKVRFLRGTKYD